ncbi:hypothetical protein CSUB01_11670 [Colletotrichum sublineola]|uniref:Transmembrane protein n=1 Tax=Colletotrichum sublineola TaxID=1173701 RepID=A0A066XNU9_COLSU|nr:hypothetical protein CSUB01_11670 [Colletotrichum sublineola]
MALSTSLLVLAALGFVSLWGGMWFNGTLEGLLRVQQTAVFPDGRPMRTNFTGHVLIDSPTILLVAFFDLITDEKTHPAAPWLVFDLCSVLAAINTWVLIESRRRGVRNLFLRHRHTARDATIPLNEARAFPLTLVANAVFPLLMFTSGGSDHEKHGFIAQFSLTPVFMVLCIVFFSRPGTSLTTFATPKDKARPNADAPWIVASLCATGVLTAAQHLYTVAATSLALTSEDAGHLTWAQVFVPSASKVLSSPQSSQMALVEGALLFTQLDWLITAIACVVFTHCLLRSSSNNGQEGSGLASLAAISLAAAILGPASAGSFALMVREKRLRAGVEVQTPSISAKGAGSGSSSTQPRDSVTRSLEH